MFIDETTIQVKAGDGGNGCYAHLREKFRPRGRPNGGNGGRGGHIYIMGTSNAHTLLDVSYHRSYKAKRGQHGMGWDKDGKNGADITIKVPLGTIISDINTGMVLCDCVEPDQNIIIARGGKGGRGNGALANRKNPNPDHAEYGGNGEEKQLRFVLKVLADIGLVGRPNAGKSTFLATISKAHPKIADYPFTTTEPQLGIVKLPDAYASFVVADIPGLIEGSHQGKGLGIRFLKHIERTRVLAIMVEATIEHPESEAAMLVHELQAYSPVLAQKPACFILTKTDCLPAGPIHAPDGWHTLSSLTRQGIDEILKTFLKLLEETNNPDRV